MTKIETDKPVHRETGYDYKGKPLVVSLHAKYLEIRQKGCHDVVCLDYGAVYEAAMKRRWLDSR